LKNEVHYETQSPSMGDVLKYELNPNFTRETITLLQGIP